MFLAIVLCGMPNNFYMTVKELCLYAWAFASRAVSGQLRVPLILFPKKRAHSAMGEPFSRCGRWGEERNCCLAGNRNLLVQPVHSLCTVRITLCFICTLSYSAEIWSIQIWTLFKSLKTQKIGNAYLFSVSSYPKEHCFCKVVRLCPLVVITAACKWRWTWSTGGTILKGENPSTQRNSFSTKNFTWNCPGSKMGLGY